MIPKRKEVIFVIILNWKNWRETIKAIESVFKTKKVLFRLVVIDNGSRDNSVKKIREFLIKKSKMGKSRKRKFNYKFSGQDTHGVEEKIGNNFLIACDENYGFCGGCNTGIYQSLENGASAVILLNNDAEVQPNTVWNMVNVLKTSQAGVVGAQIVQKKTGKLEFSRCSWPLFLFSNFWGRYPVSSPQPSFWRSDLVNGCGMLINRDVLEKRFKTDGFYLDGSFFMYREEADFCLFARNNGYGSIVARDAFVIHDKKENSGSVNPRVNYYLTRNTIYLTRRWMSFPGFLFFLAYYNISFIFRSFLRFLRHGTKRLPTICAEFAGIVDAFQIKKGIWTKH